MRSHGFALGPVVGLFVLIRLPSLTGRTETRALKGGAETRLGRMVAAAGTDRPPGESGIFPLADARDAFAARMRLIETAELSLDLQYYIWHADLSGMILLNAVLDAADRGVRVRLLLDDNSTAGLDRILAAIDLHPSIEVRLFNPLALRRPRLLGYLLDPVRLNRRMHNKSFTADNEATIIGGRNIGDEYFAASDGTLFVDLDVLAIGPVVAAVSADFDLYWSCGSAYPAASLLRAAAPEALVRLRQDGREKERDPRARRYVEAANDGPLADLDREPPPFTWAPVTMVSDDPCKALGLAKKEAMLTWAIEREMVQATETLELVSGYFVPTRSGVAMLADMRARGVEVSILTNAFEATDVGIVHAGYAKRRKALLAAGINLFELRASVRGPPAPRQHGRWSGRGRWRDRRRRFRRGTVWLRSGSVLHAKTFVVDARKLFIGSFNFDPRSAELNTELGFLIHHPLLAGRMRARLQSEMKQTAYRPVLAEHGRLHWLAESEDGEERLEREPGMNLWRRIYYAFVSRLPIEWLL